MLDFIDRIWTVITALAGSPLFQVMALVSMFVGIGVIAFNEGRDYEREARRQRLARRVIPMQDPNRKDR